MLIGVARWLELHEVADVGRWPRLAGLRERIGNDPAVRFAMAIEEGHSAPGGGGFLGHVPLRDVIEKFGTTAKDARGS
jgi:glutathione S-transferase